jgi:undecaprenyl pyrophosphate synthase
MKKNFKFSPKVVNKLFVQLQHTESRGEGEINNYNSKVKELFGKWMEQEVRNDSVREQQIHEEERDDDIQPIPLVGRTSSLQSLRSFGRWDSERSEREFGGPYYKNMVDMSLMRQNSLDSQN